MKAMILAAGRGERLRPITDTLPKPLIKVNGTPLIVRHLERLSAAGFRKVVINVSHLADQILNELGNGERWGLSIAWSHEDQPLETAGGIANARELLGTAPFLLINADVYCECPLERVTTLSLANLVGHIVMVPNPPFRPKGDFSLVGGYVGTLSEPRYTYAGIALLDPCIVEGIAAGAKAPLAPLLTSAAQNSRLGGEVYTGMWSDVGTHERLAELERALHSRT